MRKCVRQNNAFHAVNVGYMDYGPATCVAVVQRSVNAYRREAITAAKDLCYGNSVIEELHKATTESEIRGIMRHARSVKFA